MKRKYYVRYWADFANTYELCAVCDADDERALADAIAEGQDWQRITRKACRTLISEERARQKLDPAFSGYAPTRIFPARLALDPYFSPACDYELSLAIRL